MKQKDIVVSVFTHDPDDPNQPKEFIILETELWLIILQWILLHGTIPAKISYTNKEGRLVIQSTIPEQELKTFRIEAVIAGERVEVPVPTLEQAEEDDQ